MKHALAFTVCVFALAPIVEGRTFALPAKSAAPGTEVVFLVTFDDASGCASIQIQLNYDVQILDYVGFETGTGLGSQFQPTSFAENGVVTLIWTRPTGLVSGSGSLGLVKFRVNSGATTGLVTPVKISNFETSDETGVVEYSLAEPITAVSGALTVSRGELDSDLDGIPDAWETANLLDPHLSNGNADTDHDGRSDFLEYAFGGNPHAADPGRSPAASSTTDAGAKYLVLTFNRQRDTSLVYRVRESSALGTWDEIAIASRLVGSPQDQGDGTERVTVRSSFRMTGDGAAPSGFMKVELEKP